MLSCFRHQNKNNVVAAIQQVVCWLIRRKARPEIKTKYEKFFFDDFLSPDNVIIVTSAADNAIFNNRAQNIECSFGYVARRAVLLKPNVANILFLNFCEQKFVQHGPITIAIDCNGLVLLIFEKKLAQICLWTKIRTKP